MRQQRARLIFISFAALFVLSNGYAFLKDHLGEEELLIKQVAVLEADLKQERFRVALSDGELRSFRQSVAQHFSELNLTSPGKESFSRRNIASVAAVPDPDRRELELSESVFARGQDSFRNKDFSSASRQFSSFTEQFPLHEKTVEAYFLWAESEYLSGSHDKTVELTQLMLSQFPENSLTGFILLRMGQILEQQDRRLDARQVYSRILKTYDDSKLKSQAQVRLSGVRL